MGVSATASPEQRQIRVFLSSTFVDFLEERELLTKRVFPALNRRARDRGVELVDVDLRWGVTEEQTRQGQTLPLCLGEIDRCRPYFIGLLGERHGWVPPAEFYRPELLERQPWLKQHQGGASVTELEILHGVLRNPEMAGDARFYLRDPAYALAQQDPAWLAQGEEERQRLEALKQQVRASGFPVVEGLADPQAIADRIEADLWQLIEERFPEHEPPDALARDERKHASYRQARLGVYLDAAGKVQKLEDLITSGEQQILITGESGSGKSALIANWMEWHQQLHPQDRIHAHHLGCTNDSNAIQPLLARLIETASGLLEAEGLISEPVKIPQDWWDLVARVAETLQDLGRWARVKNCRWILVLDGLDRLPAEDQNALPWLPPMIPACVHLVVTALDCNARSILQQRGFMRLEIGQLQRTEQQQLIDSYLGRYTKQLEVGLEEQILRHPLANSPLFLRVLLEELRQCGRFDTLKKQLDFYLSATTIDALYERVLERLENDGHAEALRKVMTALWASRAGLSETELLAITGLAPLEWAPIDLALERAFGHNGSRLVFDHDFLRTAVEHRYLPSDEVRREAHSVLADWFEAKGRWNNESVREHPWQLVQAGRLAELKSHLVQPAYLALLSSCNGQLEAADYWRSVEPLIKSDKDNFERNVNEEIGWQLERIAARRDKDQGRDSSEDLEMLIWFVDAIAEFMVSAGFHSSFLLDLRRLSVDLTEAYAGASQEDELDKHHELAGTMLLLGMHQEAENVYLACLSGRQNCPGVGAQHPKTLATLNNLAHLYNESGQYEKAESVLTKCNEAMLEVGMFTHPNRLTVLDNLASAFMSTGRLSEAEALLSECVLENEALLGKEHELTIICKSNLSCVYFRMGDYAKAEALLSQCYEVICRMHGCFHPLTAQLQANRAEHYKVLGNHAKAESCYISCLEVQDRLLGPSHPNTRSTRVFLANLLSEQERYEEAIPLRRQELDLAAKQDGRDAPGTLVSIHHLAKDLYCADELQESEQLYREALTGQLKTLGSHDSATVATCSGLGWCLFAQERYEEAIELLRTELTWRRQHHNVTDSGTLESIEALAIALRENGELEEAETLFRELLAARQQVLEPGDFEIGRVLGILAKTLEEAGKLEQALDYGQQALDHCLAYEGPDAGWTNRERLDLAQVLHKLDRNPAALTLLEELQGSIARLDDPDEDDHKLVDDAEELMRFVVQGL